MQDIWPRLKTRLQLLLVILWNTACGTAKDQFKPCSVNLMNQVQLKKKKKSVRCGISLLKERYSRLLLVRMCAWVHSFSKSRPPPCSSPMRLHWTTFYRGTFCISSTCKRKLMAAGKPWISSNSNEASFIMLVVVMTKHRLFSPPPPPNSES